MTPARSWDTASGAPVEGAEWARTCPEIRFAPISREVAVVAMVADHPVCREAMADVAAALAQEAILRQAVALVVDRLSVVIQRI